jgi:hypothetical protein
MRKIVFYLTDSGEIDSIADYADETEDADIIADVPADCDWLEADADPETDYVVLDSPPVVTERPSIGAEDVYHVDADGVENNLFTMPDPTVVTYRGTERVAGSTYWDVGDDHVMGTGEDFLVFGGDPDLDFKFKSTRNGEFVFDITPEFPYKPITVTVIADAV